MSFKRDLKAEAMFPGLKELGDAIDTLAKLIEITNSQAPAATVAAQRSKNGEGETQGLSSGLQRTDDSGRLH